jgi:hypothetical protein
MTPHLLYDVIAVGKQKIFETGNSRHSFPPELKGKNISIG